MKFSLLFLIFAPISISAYTLTPLSTFSAQNAPTYPVGKSSRIFIVSNSAQDVLGNLGVYVGTQVANAYTLSIPGPTGSLTPLIPAQDNVILKLVQSGTQNSTGYLYITEDPNTNVSPVLSNSQKLHFQPGTNLYFALDIDSTFFNYPIADKVVISETVSFRGYAGVPEQNGLMFFDSASIKGLTTYTQLLLPLPIFHFKSNGVDVQYNLYYGFQNLLSPNYSGLMMTNGFPNNQYLASSMGVGNNNYDDLTLNMVFRFNSALNYNVTVTLQGESFAAMEPIVFPMNSSKDASIQSTSPFAVILISAGGPFSAQFRIQNLNPKPTTVVSTTPLASTVTQSTVMTTTKEAGRWNNHLLVLTIMTFLKVSM